ncbi:MAG TPA: proton-conducting transporter membrane subunit, partial [Terriglobia bacterium]|nr:proton-conducting transporter membrane subunit [Terriglobia bacterium]
MTLVLLLLAPLLEAAVCGLLYSRRWMERVSVISAAINLALAVMLVRTVARFQSVSAFDGFLYADALSALVVVLTAFVAFVCAIYAVGYFRTDFEKQIITVGKLKEYYTLTPLFVFALFLVALANNLGIMWVAIESSTLASVLLIAFYNQKTSLEAAWKYIIIGSIGISMALFGTLLAYYAASHIVGIESIEGLNWTRLVSVAPSMNPKALRLAFIFILMGYGTKAGIAPMHTWKPDSYSEAPTPSAAILA